jgi:transaldolase
LAWWQQPRSRFPFDFHSILCDKSPNQREKPFRERCTWILLRDTVRDLILENPRLIDRSNSVPSVRTTNRPPLRRWGCACFPTGIFHGVTCNPTLLERAGHACTIESLHLLAAHALSGAPFPVHAAAGSVAAVAPPPLEHAGCDEFMCQAWGGTVDELVYNGLALSSFDRSRVVVKVPVTAQGAQAARILVSEGVRVCLTACYSAQQAIVAAGVGAEYLAPYCGRMDDEGLDGKAECRKMQSIVRGCQSGTRILVASIRNVETLTDLAAAGMETFTISPDVARSLFQVRLTEQAALEFEQAAQRNGMPRMAL